MPSENGLLEKPKSDTSILPAVNRTKRRAAHIRRRFDALRRIRVPLRPNADGIPRAVKCISCCGDAFYRFDLR